MTDRQTDELSGHHTHLKLPTASTQLPLSDVLNHTYIQTERQKVRQTDRHTHTHTHTHTRTNTHTQTERNKENSIKIGQVNIYINRHFFIFLDYSLKENAVVLNIV